MKKRRDTFIFYRSWLDGNVALSEKKLGELFVMIARYALNRKSPKLKELPLNLQGAFKGAQPLLDKDIQKYENGLKGGAPAGNTNAKKNTIEKQPKNNQKTTETQLQLNLETTEIQPKNNLAHININTNTNINNDIYNTCCNSKVSKKEEINNINNKTACAHACDNVSNIDSYDKIVADLCVDEKVRPMLFEFIKHCQLNGKTVTNHKLTDIIIRLDASYGKNEQSKIDSLTRAISSGCFDVIEGKK